MKTVFLTIIFLASFYQITSAEELTLKHSIHVPTEYSNGRTQEAFEGSSDIERYVSSFEKTWWAVMNKFAHTSIGTQDMMNSFVRGHLRQRKVVLTAMKELCGKLKRF